MPSTWPGWLHSNASALGCPWTWLFVAASLPLPWQGALRNSSYWETKSKQPDFSLGPRTAGAWCQQPGSDRLRGLRQMQRAGSHGADVGIAGVAGVLSARGRWSLGKRANRNAFSVRFSAMQLRAESTQNSSLL